MINFHLSIFVSNIYVSWPFGRSNYAENRCEDDLDLLPFCETCTASLLRSRILPVTPAPKANSSLLKRLAAISFCSKELSKLPLLLVMGLLHACEWRPPRLCRQALNTMSGGSPVPLSRSI